ncbi:hypothetical protein ACLB2K_055233 [Fragaria x ananassa]
MPGEDTDHRKERMKSDCKKIMDSINAMCFENLNDEQVHSLVMMREIARGVVENRAGKVSGSDVKKALSSSIDKMVESCRHVVSILGRVSCEGLGEEEFQKLMRMKEIAMGIVLKRSTTALTAGGEQADGGDDDGSEKDMYSGGVVVESRSEDDQNERQGVVDGEIHMWNGYVPIIEGAGTESKMVEDYCEVVSRDEDAWNVGRGSVVEGTRDAGHQEQARRVEGLMFEDDCLVVVSEFETQDVKIIANSVYTTHGGLFRSGTSLRKSKRRREETLELGSLEDLSKVERSLIDAPDIGPNVLLTDVLWSDPSKEDGLVEKTFRELGLWWGPDCTEAFLRQSNLKLIIRSHEGPDVRENQDDFGDMLNGYSVDHVGESGKLYTLFSAPDYPQCGEKRYNNKGVYAVLKPPDFESPSFHSFKDVERLQTDADGDKDLVIVDKPGSVTVSSAGATSLSLASVGSEVDFKALGISNPPSSSVMMGDGVGGTQLVEVPKAPVVEGLPLPSELQVVDVSGCGSSFISRGLN